MPKHLVIVESPGKVKSIDRYLKSFEPNGEVAGLSPDVTNSFKVLSSNGHVRDLPEKGGLNIEPENGWKANYQPLPRKQKVIDRLRTEAKNAALVFLATDLDREGEAIAWHLREVLGGDDDRYVRVVFNEITEDAIHKAFSEGGVIDENRVNAQQARRFLDRVFGFRLSSLLYKKIARGLSAGRVQSVAVRLIVEREREIRAFVPREYWDIFVDLQGSDHDGPQRFQLHKPNEKRFDVGTREIADDFVSAIRASKPTVKSVTKTNRESKPAAPFRTSTLQQTAATQFGFQVARTMRLAQTLYEAGLITYMRTDSTSISDNARDTAATFIKTEHGDAYLPDKPNVYANKANSQEAHEAIRPSDVTTQPDLAHVALATSRGDRHERQAAARLYELIWRRFVASQMSPARYENTTVMVDADGHELRLTGRRTLFDGHTKVAMRNRTEDEQPELPVYREGETLEIVGVEQKQHFTKPPSRYSEARLVRELEDRGIGRPSTYASIISTILGRGYITSRGKRLYAERIAEVVTDRLTECFNELLSYEFTADMESRLDEVAEGDKVWLELLDEYHEDFAEKLDAASSRENGMRPNTPVNTDIPCDKCGRPMTIRVAGSGTFLGCSGYALPKSEQCRNTLDLISDENTVAITTQDDSDSGPDNVDDEEESRRLLAKRHCKKCGSAMDGYMMNEEFKIHICGNSPNCDGYELEAGEFKIAGYEGPIVECNKCGNDMQLKTGRWGRFFGCTNESCSNTRKLLKSGGVAAPPVPMPELVVPDEDDFFVLREGAAGIFLGASKYPKIRVIRKPRVKELISHANEIDPKFSYLLKAPHEDEDGNDTFIRYARRTKEHFVASERDSKDTGWRAYFKEGVWDIAQNKRK